MIKRSRQISDDLYNSIPESIRGTFQSSGDLRKFASLIADSAQTAPPMPGEMTVSGYQKMYNPVVPGGNYGGFGYYRSSNIPIQVLDTMRRDSQVAIGMAIVKFPITQLNFTVNCKNEAIKEFIKLNLRNKWATFVKDALKSLDFGFVGFEKVWERATVSMNPGLNKRKIKNRNFIVLKKIKPIHPKTMSVRVDDKNNFSGINQDRTGNKIVLSRTKSMMITNDEEYGNFFGKSRMVSAYEPWYWKQISTQFFLRYTERFSIPPYKVTYKPGMSRDPATGNQIDNSEIGTNMAKGIASYGNIAVPAVYDDKGNQLWDVEALNQGRLNLKPNDIVGYWNLQILRGLLIPDKASLSAMDDETASHVYLSTLAAIVKQIEEKVNTEIIQPLVHWNFMPEEIEECTFNIDDIDFKKRSEMRKLMSKILDLSASYVKNFGGLPFKDFPDLNRILETLDIPSTPARVVVPRVVDADGNEIKQKDLPKFKKTGGPDKGEITEGNKAREGRDGEVRDTEKQDAKDAL